MVKDGKNKVKFEMGKAITHGDGKDATIIATGLMVAESLKAAELLSAEATGRLQPGQELKLLSWNIGYGGLDASADFFMDGGKMVEIGTYEELMAKKGKFYELKALNEINLKKAEEGLA